MKKQLSLDEWENRQKTTKAVTKAKRPAKKPVVPSLDLTKAAKDAPKAKKPAKAKAPKLPKDAQKLVVDKIVQDAQRKAWGGKADECAIEDHVFDMDGPPPWKCTFCGYVPKLIGE